MLWERRLAGKLANCQLSFKLPQTPGEGGEAEPATSAPEKLTTRNETEAELLRAFRRLPARRRKAPLEMID